MIFDDSYDAWVAAEREARDANDLLFYQVHGDEGELTARAIADLNELRSDARSKMERMLRIASGRLA
jgi:hypothetical protein